MTPLRQIVLEELERRNYAPSTIHDPPSRPAHDTPRVRTTPQSPSAPPACAI